VNGTNVSSSSTDRLGTWTKIGNIVTLKFDFLVQPISASTNTSLTATIPFNINSGEGTQYIGSVVGSVAPYSTGFVQVILHQQPFNFTQQQPLILVG
jgi:hypothetical protein